MALLHLGQHAGAHASTAGAFEALTVEGPARERLAAFGRLFLGFKISPEPHAIERLVIGESSKFPELGCVFYNSGPGHGIGLLTAFLRCRVEAGGLDIDDPTLAADQFIGLCLADLMLKRRMGVIETATPQRIGYIVDQAVDVFLKAYTA